MTDFLTFMLHHTGGIRKINCAIKWGDFALIVTTATKALKIAKGLPMRLAHKKSAEESNRLRKQGNIHYVNGEHKEAILCYNKALAFAPNNSIEMKLAYGNISAVMLSIKAYRACQLNIKAGLEGNCPKFLRDKLNIRLKETMKGINEEIVRDAVLTSDKYLQQYIEFNVKRNDEVPCASEDVDVQNIDGSKKVVASRDIKSGTIVAMERAFVSTHANKDQYTSCYYCHKMCLFFVPCEGCCQALFCSKECRNKCMAAYHRIECQIVDYMGSLYDKPSNKLITRAAIKMSLQLSWEELRVASLDMGEERLKKSTVSEAFDGGNPVSMLSHDDQRVKFDYNKMFNAGLVCASIVDCLTCVPDYFPEETKEREKAIDTISRIMFHFYTRFTNRIEINCTAFDYQQSNIINYVQTNTGWFSFTSKLAHSCEPNLYVLGLNDQVALLAVQPIKKGEELTISYVNHFYISETQSISDGRFTRQKVILDAIQYLCQCRVCIQEWDSNSQVQGNLTERQSKALSKLVGKYHTFENDLKMSASALDCLAGLHNTKEHKRAFLKLLGALGVCQYMKTFNKTYYH